MRQPTRLVILSAIAAAVTACGNNPDTTTTSSPVPPSPTTPVVTSSPATTTTEVNLSSLGVDNLNDIKFVLTAPNTAAPNGYFDTVNGDNNQTHTLPKTGVVQLGGWAVLDTKKAPADKVIITQGDQDAVVAIAPVEVDRPDLVQVSPNYKTAGWNADVDAAKLTGDSVVLKAWAYDAEQKTAFQLNNAHTLDFTSADTSAPAAETTPTPSAQP